MRGMFMKIDSPKISTDLPTRNFYDIFYEEDPILEMCTIIDSVFENEMAGRVFLANAVVKNCRFNHTDFTNMDITDVCFENCDLSNANLSKSSIHRVEFKNCKLVGVNFTESRF